MEYISVSQQLGDVSQALYDKEKAAGHVAAPMMGGLQELLQVPSFADITILLLSFQIGHL